MSGRSRIERVSYVSRIDYGGDAVLADNCPIMLSDRRQGRQTASRLHPLLIGRANIMKETPSLGRRPVSRSVSSSHIALHLQPWT